jgi:hypothetical protein
VRAAHRNVDLLDDPVRLAAAYESSTSIAELATGFGVSGSTVRRALVRHGINRLPRNRNRRPPSAHVLDDLVWLRERYRTSSGVEIANELGFSARTVYAAMDRHGVARRTEPGALKLRHPELVDEEWLRSAVERGSSTAAATELNVSAGTVTGAYQWAGIDPGSTRHLYERGRSSLRPSEDQHRSAWEAEETFRGGGTGSSSPSL